MGGEETLPVDVRVIAATNKPLLKEIEEGRFREDLYYRLNVIALNVPALRDRREDIPLLANRFLTLFAEKNRKSVKGFSPQAMDGMLQYRWPGNVRELMNAVERSVVMSRHDYINLEELPLEIKEGVSGNDQAPAPSSSSPDVSLMEVEKQTILRTLEATEGNKSEAARRLGITRKTLHKKLKSYGIMP